eukprot:CAMPEP_0184300544 /NCGR_PEP_ID=MMETSP1049-20130417/10937_1 /TAXON_ID=77928 /ORGANISM="Proteomonas sulcata, Strain CCMP704" /LENGTH=60 /DNA_ID=CAMNT_0026611293 /DNA_START=101 /DNA_END=280 /DNA_ORIENTATION=+
MDRGFGNLCLQVLAVLACHELTKCAASEAGQNMEDSGPALTSGTRRQIGLMTYNIMDGGG